MKVQKNSATRKATTDMFTIKFVSLTNHRSIVSSFVRMRLTKSACSKTKLKLCTMTENVEHTVIIIRLHQMHEMQSIVTDIPVAWGVCQCVSPPWLCKNGWLNRGPVCSGCSWGPKEHCITTDKSTGGIPPRIWCKLCQITLASCYYYLFFQI